MGESGNGKRIGTPVSDFVRAYAAAGPLRLHMPGHKGRGPLGVETLDITEIPGADVLYSARGIIRESEELAAALFGAGRTLYSAEGSSLCVRAMLYLALLHGRTAGRRRILAGRNAHRSFLSAAALLDAPVEWLYPSDECLLSGAVTPAELEAALAGEAVAAVYLTAPDYLGHLPDLGALAQVCHAHGALLLVDNAHGAYLRFLPQPRHPMELGADLCCDSAHKTLPVLTGGAYLHLSAAAPAGMAEQAERAMALFATTSPSYLILQSLDAANPVLAGRFPAELGEFLPGVEALKDRLREGGWTLVGEEPLKLTLACKGYGYTGAEVAAALRGRGIESEFADPDFLVLMLTPEVGKTGLARLEAALRELPRRAAISGRPPAVPRPRRVLSPREALLAPAEELPVEAALGRVLADPAVSCPPAVPILICGEEIDADAMRCFAYYGIRTCPVVKEARHAL